MTFPISIKKLCSLVLCFAIAISAGSSWGQIMGQDDKPEPPPKNVALEYPIGELEAMTLEQLNAELEKLTPGFRESLKAMWTAKVRYEHADKAESYGYGKTWRKNAIEGQKAFQKLKELSMEIYLKADNPTREQFELARGMTLGSVGEGRVGIAHRVLEKMMKRHPNDEDISMSAGRVAVFTNDFEAADRLLQAKPKLIADLPREEVALFATLKRTSRELGERTGNSPSRDRSRRFTSS